MLVNKTGITEELKEQLSRWMSCPHGPVNNGQVWIWGEKAKVLNDL